MANPLLRSAILFTGALVGGAIPVVTLPLDKLIEGAFAHKDAAAARKLSRFSEAMAEEWATVGPSDHGTREAVCLKIEAAIQRFPLTHHRLAELDLDPAKATEELARHLAFATTSERTELEQHCRNLIQRYYEKLPRHALILADMLPELWAVVLRRLDDLQQLVATMAANDAERRDLQAQVNRLRDEGHILDRAIITLLQDVGERIGDPSAYPDQLRRAGERYQELLAAAERPRNLPPEFEAVRQDAATLIREGRLDDADALLLQLDQRMAAWEAEQEAMVQQGKRDRASVRAERAKIAHTRFRYRESAALYADAASLVAFDAEYSSHLLLLQAVALNDLGLEFNDFDALVEAVDVHRQTLGIFARADRPLDWAGMHNNFGLALALIGERFRMLAYLDDAILAFDKSLEEWTPEVSPIEWAMAQVNRGLTLTNLSDLQIEKEAIASLREAIASHRRAINLYESVRDPKLDLLWAAAQNNLGLAQWRLGDIDGGTANLKRAVAAFRKSASIEDRKREPFRWAQVMENIARVQYLLGQRLCSKQVLEDSLACLNEALEVYHLEPVPFYQKKAQRLRDKLTEALRG